MPLLYNPPTHAQQVVLIELFDACGFAEYRKYIWAGGVYDLCFERPLTQRCDFDKNVIAFLSLSPFKDEPLLLACVYKIMGIAYE